MFLKTIFDILKQVIQVKKLKLKFPAIFICLDIIAPVRKMSENKVFMVSLTFVFLQ